MIQTRRWSLYHRRHDLNSSFHWWSSYHWDYDLKSSLYWWGLYHCDLNMEFLSPRLWLKLVIVLTEFLSSWLRTWSFYHWDCDLNLSLCWRSFYHHDLNMEFLSPRSWSNSSLCWQSFFHCDLNIEFLSLRLWFKLVIVLTEFLSSWFKHGVFISAIFLRSGHLKRNGFGGALFALFIFAYRRYYKDNTWQKM